jgi:hypothetical protein
MKTHVVKFSVMLLTLLMLDACGAGSDSVVGSASLAANPSSSASSATPPPASVPVQTDPSLPKGSGCQNGGSKLQNALNPIFSFEVYCSNVAPSAKNDDVLLTVDFKKDAGGNYPVTYDFSSIQSKLGCTCVTVSAAFCQDSNNSGSCVQQPHQNIFFQVVMDGAKLEKILTTQPSVYYRLPAGTFSQGFNFVVSP